MLEERLRQAEKERSTKMTNTLLDTDPRPDVDVQRLQKKLVCVKRKVDKQERQTFTEIDSLCADASTKDALVASYRGRLQQQGQSQRFSALRSTTSALVL